MKTLSSIRVKSPFAGHPISLRQTVLCAAIFAASLPLLHAENTSIADVQAALKKQSFYYGEVTGGLDEETRAGLRRFQIRNGLPATGEADATTIQALKGDLPPSPERNSNATVPSAAQNDRAFLAQIEKDEKRAAPDSAASPGVLREAPAAVSAGEPPKVTPPDQDAPPKPASNVAGQESVFRPPTAEKTDRERSPEAKHAKAITERRSEPRTQKIQDESETVEDGLLESPGVKIHTFSNPQRERPAQSPESANPPGGSASTLPPGTTVTTTTTTYRSADGLTHISKKTTTSIPNASKAEPTPPDTNAAPTTRPRRFLFWDVDERGRLHSRDRD